MSGREESGFVLVTLLTLLIPLVIAAAAVTSAMTGKGHELRVELDQEIALLAAESGVDAAIYEGRIGNLVDGTNFTTALGSGQAYTVEPTYLKTDGVDNDNDGLIDEDDEDVFQVVVTGTYRDASRKLAAYLGPVPLLPVIDSGFATMDQNVSVQLSGTPVLSGYDTNFDGSAGPGPDVPALAIAPPGTVAHLDSELNGGERNNVVGPGGPPSLGTTAALDLPTLVAQMQNIANLVLTSDKYSSFDFGSGASGVANIAYRDGDLSFAGNSTGAGILVVTGDLTLKGTFRFDGVIIVLGNVDNAAGTASVYGSIIQGPSGALLDTKGTFDLHYSSQGVNLANSVSGRYVAFNGWQELAN